MSKLITRSALVASALATVLVTAVAQTPAPTPAPTPTNPEAVGVSPATATTTSHKAMPASNTGAGMRTGPTASEQMAPDASHRSADAPHAVMPPKTDRN